MESRALGKGLSALIPERIIAEGKEAISYVDVSLIKENSLQPRQNYDESKINDLKESIKEQGMLQPILVRKSDNGFEVVAGERRLRAARSLDMKEVPVIVKNVSNEEALVLALVENIQREELNAIEEAQAFKKLIDDFGLSQDKIAQSLGKDKSTVSNILRLLKLPLDIQAAIVSGVISMGHARALVGLDNSLKQKELFGKIVQKGLSVREIENLIQGIAAADGKKKRLSGKVVDHEVDVFESDLRQDLGTKVQVLSKRKRGKIVIEYYSLDDLERILELLIKDRRNK